MPNHSVGSAPHQRRIDAEHVQLTLSIAKGRSLGLLDVGPWCALSNGATPYACRERLIEEPDSRTRWTHRPLALPMLTCITPSMVNRVRTHYGLDEVRKTWGIGYRALLAELKGKKAVAA